MVKAYDGALILADTLLLFIKIFYSIIEGIYRLVVPVQEKSVVGEIVLVTGAGHGIGRELAIKYASLGATVVCWDINQDGNEDTVKEIKKLGAASAHGYKCDVSNRDDVVTVAAQVQKEVGNVTILVNNAGIMPCRTFFDYTPAEIRRIFDINVLAHFWTLQAFLPNMINNNHGHVVALSSIAGIVGLENLVPYCGSKFAVRGLMDALIEEVRIKNGPNCNVKFTTIYPYMVDTGLCKKPKMRFPSLMSLVSPQEAVSQIVSAQRRDLKEISIPVIWIYVASVLGMMPNKAQRLVQDFFDSGVEAEC
ncbi:short-chain dehydrogenase/reductase family 16C member 6 [Cephus cinctus]|uniref:Short-chain dehydrogenase/reductase 3 n=1 Tax=Cephus cinctus TaxID=211228 RepID=A0AAJ7C5U7_CEPCN|nr:short-chain dehydrogenase/reductase family 16C member 6 [Cephus cinctus]XP_015602720.1 short-chain dehydrogenase/reductase family 16C member 6 [Cephus cinctus]XP_015602721.1 short-chain dehydrogenase/reductase family 16C member 6 [Cephus cinctus]XP_015602722.1 short-chain dehydrogenase/reductase family 16C member 6 [Cephus cinctus]XP_015602723.1 short-chain dehydrogenase/reductase family 16C member 6 [Cephus cinctus]XP_015602724.1 short-chain dehydrogenase/reductase family 16C member 6 [Cep